MAGASRPTAGTARGLIIHNEGPSTATVHIVVHADGVPTESVTLAAGETHRFDGAVDASVEVHTKGGMATAFGGHDPLFVIRDGSVLVAPN
jgi:hypothetical protein